MTIWSIVVLGLAGWQLSRWLLKSYRYKLQARKLPVRPKKSLAQERREALRLEPSSTTVKHKLQANHG